jgi:hypothetical protein
MPTILEILDGLLFEPLVDVIIDYTRNRTFEEGHRYRTSSLCSIRETLANLLLAPLADMVIGYERHPECTCYTFEGDKVPYLHWQGCPRNNYCFECGGSMREVASDHAPTCSARCES